MAGALDVHAPRVETDFERFGAFDLVNNGAVDEHLLVFHRGIQVLLGSTQAFIPTERANGLRVSLEHSLSGAEFPDLFGMDFAERTLHSIWSGFQLLWENPVYAQRIQIGSDRGVHGRVLVPDLRLRVVRRPDVEQFMHEHKQGLARLGLEAQLD